MNMGLRGLFTVGTQSTLLYHIITIIPSLSLQ